MTSLQRGLEWICCWEAGDGGAEVLQCAFANRRQTRALENLGLSKRYRLPGTTRATPQSQKEDGGIGLETGEGLRGRRE